MANGAAKQQLHFAVTSEIQMELIEFQEDFFLKENLSEVPPELQCQ
jgi:hypothetical protein